MNRVTRKTKADNITETGKLIKMCTVYIKQQKGTAIGKIIQRKRIERTFVERAKEAMAYKDTQAYFYH